MECCDLLISLIKAKINNDNSAAFDNLSHDVLRQLYSLSASHDLSHIVGQALADAGASLPDDVANAFKKSVSIAMYRYLQLSRELQSISSALESAEIDFMPLKGSVLRNYYAEPWMRTSCDIDVLVRPSDVNRCAKALSSALNYKIGRRESHDVSLYSQSGAHIELHFDLIEDGAAVDYFKKIWDYALPNTSSSHKFEMPPEIFLAYHIAHMAKHFSGGGCGIRPFIDLYVMMKKMSFDNERVNEILNECGLLTFYKGVCSVSDAWFGQGEHNELTLEIQDYIIRAGVYGTIENRVAIKQVNSGGKLKYIINRIFLPYEKLKAYYPRLNGKKILIPFYQVKRWFAFLKRKDKKRAITELNLTATVSENKINRLSSLMKSLDLN